MNGILYVVLPFWTLMSLINPSILAFSLKAEVKPQIKILVRCLRLWCLFLKTDLLAEVVSYQMEIRFFHSQFHLSN